MTDFTFNVEKVESSGNNTERKQIDWEARSKYIVEKVGTTLILKWSLYKRS